VWPGAEAARLCGLEQCRRCVAGPAGAPRHEPSWLRYRLLDMLTFLPDRMLAKVDRASMHHALEVRVPLLDHRVASSSCRCPRAR